MLVCIWAAWFHIWRASASGAIHHAVAAVLTPLALLGWAFARGTFGRLAGATLLAFALVFCVIGQSGNIYWGLLYAPLLLIGLSLSPFRRVIKDYFTLCDSYYAAIRQASPTQIEAIDMGRRGLHNDGAALLRERLKGKIACDADTARRLFTLICALHWKG